MKNIPLWGIITVLFLIILVLVPNNIPKPVKSTTTWISTTTIPPTCPTTSKSCTDNFTAQWLQIWGGANGWYSVNASDPVSYGQLFDTFQMHVILASLTPIKVIIFSQPDGGANPLNATPITTYNGTYIDFYFNQSEGCDAYFYLVSAENYSSSPASFQIYPNVTARYAPTTVPTGVCAK